MHSSLHKELERSYQLLLISTSYLLYFRSTTITETYFIRSYAENKTTKMTWLYWLSLTDLPKNRNLLIIIITSSHGENGSRPQRPLYPRNNDKVHFILHKILYYNTTVSDAMEICFVIIHHVLIDPEFI